ncbi:MAG: eukaryotic-like serine/threonine-protein kinase [Actinoplanes sp.]|jgi:serine/threonine-protein kinase|nr:eukaryotic-like serine/threonine-protein kinase [Actinoplanes sp.]
MRVDQVLGGRYRLREPLGSGGTAVVWHAYDEVLGRSVAVKLLADRHHGDLESRQQIRAEARAAAALSHPNIAQVYDYGESPEGLPYVVMELVRGQTLQHRLAAGPLPPRYAMRVAAEVSAALAAAHADGLVHRDIKPGNIMVTPAGVKVVDFGIAAAVRPGGSPEESFEVLGTPAYVAPERLIDDAVEPASDIYSVGVLLYRMLTGSPPWNVDTTTQVLAAHVGTKPLPLPAISGVPGYVAELCDRCLSKDPTERPSAREAAMLLAQGAGLRVVEDEPAVRLAAATADTEPSVLIRKPAQFATVPPAISAAAPDLAATPTQVVDPVQGAAHRHRRRAWLVGAAVAVVVAALLWLVIPGWHTAPPSAGLLPAVQTSPGLGLPTATLSLSVTAPAAPGTVSPPPPSYAPVATTSAGAPTQRPTTRPTATKTSRPTPTTPSTSKPPTKPRVRTFSSAGGSVTATCPTVATAQLLSWGANKPYKVQKVEAGPSAAPFVVFRHGNSRVRMTVTCSGGEPSATTD